MTLKSTRQVLATPQTGRLTTWQKIAYGLGDIFGGGNSILINFTYLYFLTSVVRINPALAGTVILISRAYDAITDPVEGIIADRTRTRWGRRRPYLAAGIPLIFISFFALYYPANFDDEIARFIFVTLTYLFFSTVLSIVKLNYDALQSELTLDYNERTALSSVRILFSTLSAILCAVVPLQLVENFDDVRTGYIVMALVFGAVFALPFIATVSATRERPDFQRQPQPFNWRRTFIEPFQMRAFVIVLLMYLFAFLAIDVVTNIIIYYMTYYIGRGSDSSFVLGALLVAQVFSLPFYTRLSRRTSKRTGYIVGAVIWAIAMLFSLLITPASPSWTIYALALTIGLGTGGIVVMIYAMFPDIPDIDELQSGERREGIYFAMLVFMRKLSSALAIFLVSNAINLAGYVPPVEVVENGATQLINQPQSEAFINILRVIFAFSPIILLAVGVFFALRYPLTAQVHARLNGILSARRDGSAGAETDQEAAVLHELLIGTTQR